MSPPGLKVSNNATVEAPMATTNSSRNNEAAGPKWKQHSVVGMASSEVKSSGIKNNAAQEAGMLDLYFCCSITKSCLTLVYLMDCSTPGFPVLHYLLKFAQTHVRWVSDAI